MNQETGISDILQSMPYVRQAHLKVRELELTLGIPKEVSDRFAKSERYLDIREYAPKVRAKIWACAKNDKPCYFYTLSHFVQTPDMVEPLLPTRTIFDTEGAAIVAAVQMATVGWEAALDEGEIPDAGWLVPNPDY